VTVTYGAPTYSANPTPVNCSDDDDDNDDNDDDDDNSPADDDDNDDDDDDDDYVGTVTAPSGKPTARTR